VISAKRQQMTTPSQNVVVFLGGRLSFSGSGRKSSLSCGCMSKPCAVRSPNATPGGSHAH
jgi:hypothetical protein